MATWKAGLIGAVAYTAAVGAFIGVMFAAETVFGSTGALLVISLPVVVSMGWVLGVWFLGGLRK